MANLESAKDLGQEIYTKSETDTIASGKFDKTGGTITGNTTFNTQVTAKSAVVVESTDPRIVIHDTDTNGIKNEIDGQSGVGAFYIRADVDAENEDSRIDFKVYGDNTRMSLNANGLDVRGEVKGNSQSFDHPVNGGVEIGWEDDYLRYRFGGTDTPKGIRIDNYDTHAITLGRYGDLDVSGIVRSNDIPLEVNTTVATSDSNSSTISIGSSDTNWHTLSAQISYTPKYSNTTIIAIINASLVLTNTGTDNDMNVAVRYVSTSNSVNEIGAIGYTTSADDSGVTLANSIDSGFTFKFNDSMSGVCTRHTDGKVYVRPSVMSYDTTSTYAVDIGLSYWSITFMEVYS
jgi:hypothetical protein